MLGFMLGIHIFAPFPAVPIFDAAAAPRPEEVQEADLGNVNKVVPSGK